MDRKLQISDTEDMGVQNFNSAPKFAKNMYFWPHIL